MVTSERILITTFWTSMRFLIDDSMHAVKHAVFDKVYKTWILTSCVAIEKEKFMLIPRKVLRKAV